MDEKNKDVKADQEARPTRDLEIDESLLSEEEKKQNGYRFPKGMLVFMIVIAVLIIGLSIAVLLL